MNWIKVFLFLITIFLFYRLLGKTILSLIGVYERKGSEEVIIGFFTFFFLGFLVGVPCQLFHASWNTFRTTFTIVIMVSMIISIKKSKEDIFQKIKNMKKNVNQILINHLKNYWFLYLLTIFFCLLSFTNALPYYYMNYDDSYYIGKIVNQVGSIGLLNENYYNANLIVSGYDVGITRIFNTYEIVYGYLAVLFHISIPFFCRVGMVIHNYLIIFLSYILFAELYISKKYAQFSLIPFTILLISSGFLISGQSLPFNIRMYDGWQFQTAIFYGGSVVRCLMIPVSLIFGSSLMDRIEIKKVILISIIYMALLSFSTIFIQYAIVMVLFFGVVKIINIIKENKSLLKKRIWIIMLFFFVTILILTKKIDTIPAIGTESFFYNMQEYENFFQYYFGSDLFANYAPFILMYFIYTFTEKNQKNINLYLLLIFLFIFSNQFKEFLVLSSFNNFFVCLRFITSIQMIIVIFIGIAFVKIISKMKFKKILLYFISLSTLFGIFGFIYINKDQIATVNFLGSGMSYRGYNLNIIKDNDEMIPNIMVEVGDYFNDLEYGNYSLLLPKEVPFKDTTIPSKGFIICSNRIEICEYGGCNVTENELEKINNFYIGEIDFEEIENIIKNKKINYMMVFNEKDKNTLQNSQYELVLEREKEYKYYLFKMN